MLTVPILINKSWNIQDLLFFFYRADNILVSFTSFPAPIGDAALALGTLPPCFLLHKRLLLFLFQVSSLMFSHWHDVCVCVCVGLSLCLYVRPRGPAYFGCLPWKLLCDRLPWYMTVSRARLRFTFPLLTFCTDYIPPPHLHRPHLAIPTLVIFLFHVFPSLSGLSSN